MSIHAPRLMPTRSVMPGPTRGFTLVELLVALVIAGLVVLVAAQVFRVVGDASRQLRTGRAALDREMNARRWLASAFLSLDVGTEGAGPFEGRPDRVVFAAWRQTADGWLERAPIELARHEQRLVAVSAGDSIVLADGLTAVAFDYLLEPGADATWVRAWSSPVSAPLAVRVRLTRAPRGAGDSPDQPVSDTTLYLIKARG